MLAAWSVDRIVVFCIPFGLLLLAGVVWLFLRHTIRSRFRVNKALRADPDINEWLIVFNWSRKVLYFPTIFASIVAGVLMLFFPTDSTPAQIIGGCWLGVFFANFLVDEYEISVKVLLIGLLFILLIGLWLTFMHWLKDFLNCFRHLGISMTSAGYFVIAAIFILAIVVSYLRGLFYFVAITPNYLNIQSGPTETGEQLNHTDYSTRVDTGDFLERMLGFGRIVITFRDHRREPMSFLIGRIGKRATKLEAIRGKLAVDSYQLNREGGA